MPGWLGASLAAAFALVAGHRGVRKDAPGALMALGMAVMAVQMAGPLGGPGSVEADALGPLAPHGPWWAAAFAVVALWPLVGRGAAERVCGGPAAHLVAGLAMIYMCTLTPAGHGAASTAGADAALAASAGALGGSGHGGHGGAPLAIPHVGVGSAPVDGVLALAGWALACYFLLATVTALTRRGADGALTLPRLAVLGEAAMGFGTVIMLVAMS
jgi:Domain of unknown function (DUF5134)